MNDNREGVRLSLDFNDKFSFIYLSNGVYKYVNMEIYLGSMYINQQDAQNLVIRLYFLLDALHVSDCMSPSSGATSISCTSYLVYGGICRFV